MITQSSNLPLTIEFDAEIDCVDLSVLLSSCGQELRRWGLADVEILGNVMICPLTQQETAGFPPGTAVLEIKWLDKDGLTVFAEPVKLLIKKREDLTILEESK